MGEPRTARPLLKVDKPVPCTGLKQANRRISTLYRAVRREQQMRREAERNANRFHALLIQARVELINRGERS